MQGKVDLFSFLRCLNLEVTVHRNAIDRKAFRNFDVADTEDVYHSFAPAFQCVMIGGIETKPRAWATIGRKHMFLSVCVCVCVCVVAFRTSKFAQHPAMAIDFADH